MARRFGIVLAVALVASSVAGAHGTVDRKQAVDSRIGELRARVAEANRREAVLTTEISAVTSRIRSLEDDVAAASARLARLEDELAVYEERLARLTELYRLQSERLRLLREQFAIAQSRLNARLVAIYEASEPSAVEVLLAARSFTDMLDQLDYVNDLSTLDQRISTEVATAREKMRVARLQTARTRASVARTARAVRVRVAEQRAQRSRLLASQTALAGARRAKRRTLAAVHADERELLHEIEGLERVSAQLSANIQRAQASSAVSAAAPVAGVASSSGFVWPVSGPVTSGFGWRWGRMHEGIDIAAPSGTPIRAAAGGSVIYAGWMSGYGNLVVVDHGGGIATAYAHMSSIGAGVGQGVGQGQVIGYVGCTGHCYGDHLHFEVRVNGSAVDPLGYL